MKDMIPMTAEEKWAAVCKFTGIMNNPKNLTTETVIGLHLYPSLLGNGAKYLMLNDIKEHLKKIPEPSEDYCITSIDKYDGYTSGYDINYYDKDEMNEWLETLTNIVNDIDGYEKLVRDNRRDK